MALTFQLDAGLLNAYLGKNTEAIAANTVALAGSPSADSIRLLTNALIDVTAAINKLIDQSQPSNEQSTVDGIAADVTDLATKTNDTLKTTT